MVCLNLRPREHLHSWGLPGCMSSIQKAVSQTHHLRKNISDNQWESTMHKHWWTAEWKTSSLYMLIPWRQIEQKDLGGVRTKPRDSVALRMPYDERLIKDRSQLLGMYLEPVLFSNKMHWFHLDRVFVDDITDTWVPELAPRYWDHELNWRMIPQHLALNCSA